MSETISKEDREFLDQIRESDPEFVRQYLGAEQMEEATDGKEEKEMNAVTRGMNMLHTPSGKLPKLACEYYDHLVKKLGERPEVGLTAFAAYAQCVEGLECDDDRYKANDEAIEWFAQQHLGTSDCADFLRVCNNTVLNYIKNGKLAATQEYGRWKIKQEDLLNFSKTREQEQEQGEDDMSKSKTRSPNRNPNIIKFLREWPLAKSPIFTLQEITRDFNKQYNDNMTENQMSSLLSNLKKKGVTVAKGRAAYSVSPTFFPKENAIEHHSIPAIIEDEEVIESPESCLTEKEIEPSLKLSGKQEKIENMKSPERKAVDKFIEERFKGYEDLVFSTADVAKAIPHMDRHLLSKAIQNMKSTGQLEKGDELGVYIKKANKQKPIEVAPIRPSQRRRDSEAERDGMAKSSSTFFDKIDEIRRSNINDKLKEELVRNLA